MQQTKHASIRSQQRGIPPFVDRLLDEFGEQDHDGHGYVRVYFSHRSIRNMERSLGRQPVSLFQRYLRAYKVESTFDGNVITRGWLTRRVKQR